MTVKTLEFEADDALGRAFRIDTGSVWAEAGDPDRLTRIGIGTLVAFQGAESSEYLVGTLDRVTRDFDVSPLEDPEDEGDEFAEPPSRPRDLFRVVLVGTYRTVEGTLRNTFKRGTDSFPLVDALCWPIQGKNLQALMGVLGDQLEPEKQLCLGAFVADPTALAVADGNRLFQRHAALLGSTGSGKSWAVALMLERASALAHPNLVVFDMHGEYTPLTEGDAAIARGFRVAGPATEDDDDTALRLPFWLLNQEEMQALLLDRSESNAPNQASRLVHHVRELKQNALIAGGRNGVAASFTVDSPIPYALQDLIDRLSDDDTEMVQGQRGDKQGPFFGKLTRFVSRLQSRADDRRYGFMFDVPDAAQDYLWLHGLAHDLLGTAPGIKIIDFSEVPSDVLPVVVGVLARLLYEIHFWTDDSKRSPVTLVCDEAHLYLPAGSFDAVEERALDVFERIAKEGRKYGMSLLVVSQRPSDVSRTVLSQCNNFIALRLTNDQDQSVVRRLMPESMSGITASLPLLDVGEALVLGDAMVLPTRVKLDRPKTKPLSATRDFWTDWNSMEVAEQDVSAAVEAMRTQTRGAAT